MKEKTKNILWVVLAVVIFGGFILSCVFDWGEKCAKCGRGFYKENVYVVGQDKYHNACKPIGHYE